MTDSTPLSPTPSRVLVVQAHPDDAEFTCGGTIAKWIRDGAEVHYCSITSGNRGSADPEMTPERLVEIRKVEQQKAADILGVKGVYYLDREDGLVVADLELRRDIARVIRKVKPEAVVGFDPTARILGNAYINHPDHVAAGDALLWGMFPAAGNRMYFPELIEEGYEPHHVSRVYLFGTDQPNAWIDITDTIDIKLEALLAHASQFRKGDPTEMTREWAKRDALANPNRESAGTYAESFRFINLG
jgi:LmbE family N-acetylglucosaminyl deacetylase